MNAKSNNPHFLFVLLVVLFSACSKKVVGPGASKLPAKAEVNAVITKVNSGEVTYEHFSAKAKTEIAPEGEKDYSATLHIRMKRDKYLWASVNVMLGIEAARLYVTQDSVFILNRLKKEYVAQSLAYFQQFSRAPISLKTVQQMLVGNTLFPLPDTLQSDTNTADGWFFSLALQQVVYGVYVNKDNMKATAQHLNDSARQQQLHVYYSDYQKENVQNIPRKIALHTASKAQMKVTFDYQNVSFAPFDEISFSIPASYKPAK